MMEPADQLRQRFGEYWFDHMFPSQVPLKRGRNTIRMIVFP
jgi:hypothetical protein